MKQDLFQAPDYYNIDELLTDEHKLIRDSAREWVKKEISPIIEDCCQKAKFPKEIIPGLGEIGPTSSFVDGFSAPGRLVLLIFMLIGRLEIFPMLLMFVLPYRTSVEALKSKK